jgi:hypothetical protein
MPIPKTKMAERLMRWMLAHTAPAPLSIDHPVQVDIADAADEIERLSAALGREREAIASKAREWAAHYPEASDGRNTFVLLAEWIEARGAS